MMRFLHSSQTWFAALMAVLLGGVAVLAFLPQPTEAQCGSSMSSCKTCHEVMMQDPVNTEGDWHTQHAFGDFCEFCHAGNPQSTAKDESHQGLIPPMEDVAASCQSCHPQDYKDKAGLYATALGITLETEPAPAPSAGGESGGAAAAPAASGEANVPVINVAPPLGGEEIDYNLLYARKVNPPLLRQYANVIMWGLIGLVGIAFLITAWKWEGWGPKVAAWLINDETKIIRVKPGEVPTSEELVDIFRHRPVLQELWPRLVNNEDGILDDLQAILQDEEGVDILHAIGHLDLNLAKTLKQMSEEDRELLLALVKEM